MTARSLAPALSRSLLHAAAFVATALVATAASAHVVLPPGGAAADSTYRAEFIVGHPCQGSHATSALSVKLPAGFTLVKAEPRAGWSLGATAERVTWTAASGSDAVPGRTSFWIVGKVGGPTTLWFPALQTCDAGASDWAVIPDAAHPTSDTPAPHLDVLAPGRAAVDARDARVQPTIAGQTSASVFMRLSAPSGARLVGASTPAGSAELHEMAMEGDVMRMRELPGGLELPPGQAVELTPSTRHIMVMGLKQPLPAGATLPLTLHFVDREGRRGDLPLQVPAAASGAASAAGMDHQHMR